MTPQEWKEVEESLKSFYKFVKLKCDNYEVTLQLRRQGQFKNVIDIYINGSLKGIWIITDCEERRRFFCPRRKYFHTQKERRRLKKMPKQLLQKLRQESKLFDPDASITYYCSYWTSFKSLKRHLIANNSSIELIREEDANADRQQGENPDTHCQDSTGTG